jgi:hypothetical protein
MFNNRDSYLNTKIVVLLTCELSTCGLDGSPSVVGQENDNGCDAPYGVYPCCKKLLSMRLSNICMKLEKLHST